MPVIREASRFPIRALTDEDRRRRGAFIADVERHAGFALTPSEAARAVRLRAGKGHSAPWLAAAIQTTRTARGKL